jgi:hypothetical protein
MKITATHIGNVIIVNESLTTMTSEKFPGSSGSVALAMDLDKDGKPATWQLIWCWNGDWMGFEDGNATDADNLDGWEPQAIRDAVDALGNSLSGEVLEDILADMEWFLDWAKDAEKTLSAKTAE